MSEIYKLSGFQQELDKAERFFSMHLTRQELKSRLDETERLHSIIKEVREYIENNKQYAELEDYGKNGEYYIDEIGLLEILDKESDK